MDQHSGARDDSNVSLTGTLVASSQASGPCPPFSRASSSHSFVAKQGIFDFDICARIADTWYSCAGRLWGNSRLQLMLLVTPVEEKDLGLTGLFWLPSDPEDPPNRAVNLSHPSLSSSSVPELSRSKCVLSTGSLARVDTCR